MKEQINDRMSFAPFQIIVYWMNEFYNHWDKHWMSESTNEFYKHWDKKTFISVDIEWTNLSMSSISTEKRNLRNKLEGFILIKSFWAKILPCKKKKTFFIRIEFRKILNEDNIVQGQINTKNFSFNPKENVLENLTLT